MAERRHEPEVLDLGEINPEDLGRDATTPAQRREYAQPIGKKPGRVQKVFGRVFGGLLVIILAVVVLYGWFAVRTVAKISTNPWILNGLNADGAGRTNVLVLGLGDPGHAGEKLTDTILMLSLQGDRAAYVSVPRDLRVPISGFGSGKVNSANVYGGPDLAESTVEGVLGQPMSGRIVVDFSAISRLIDAVGGIDVDVKDTLIDPEYPCDDNQFKSCGLRIEAGHTHMDGALALKYVRCRKGTCGNDFGRASRQQEVIGLLRPKLVDPALLIQPARLNAVTNALTEGFSTNLSVWQMLQLALKFQQSGSTEPIRYVLSTANGGLLRADPGGSSDLLPIGGSFTAIQQKVANIFEDPNSP